MPSGLMVLTFQRVIRFDIKDLKQDQRLLNKVILEEFGHWLDDVTGDDSQGDEGNLFARALLNDQADLASSANLYQTGYLQITEKQSLLNLMRMLQLLILLLPIQS